MDFGDSAELAEFRTSLREWLKDNKIEQLPGEDYPTMLLRWNRILAGGGWVGLSWPPQYGGRGLGPEYEAIVNEEIGIAGAPEAPRVGYLGRAILEYGTEEQKERFLPGLLDGSESWCQGFSEPGAGSDLASLTTKAVLDGDDYVINGQKVWTSYAEYADFCLLLARIGSPEERHKGVAAFILPMKAMGVDVRPLRAITDESEFCEVFLSDVRIPADMRIGGDGDGWRIAMMTVAYERGAADVGYLSKFSTVVTKLEASLASREHRDASLEDRLRETKVVLSILKYHVRRRFSVRQLADSPPGAEMSVDKMLMTYVDQTLHENALEIIGPDCLRARGENEWFRKFLYSRAASIYGGSTQIQFNIIARRILGLP